MDAPLPASHEKSAVTLDNRRTNDYGHDCSGL
jgi:hypothetical protein